MLGKNEKERNGQPEQSAREELVRLAEEVLAKARLINGGGYYLVPDDAMHRLAQAAAKLKKKAERKC